MIRRATTLGGLLALTFIVAACGSGAQAPTPNPDGTTPIAVGTSAITSAQAYRLDRVRH